MRRKWESVRNETRRCRIRGEDVLREDVEHGVYDSADVARAEAGNDHRAQACLRAQRRDECGGHGPQRAKAQDRRDRVPARSKFRVSNLTCQMYQISKRGGGTHGSVSV